MRFLTNAALVMGAIAHGEREFNQLGQNLCNREFVTGAQQARLAEFCMDHVESDWRVLQQIINRPAEEVSLIMHSVIHRLTESKTESKAESKGKTFSCCMKRARNNS